MQLMPIVNFDLIKSEELCVTTDDLSTDQKYLAKIYNCVRNSFVNDSLSVQDPGNKSHSRWLTTANRS